MKRLVKILLACVLMAGMLWIPRTTGVAATASASLIASSAEVSAGQTVSVILNVSGDNIYGVSGRLVYDSTVLTLQKWEKVLGTWDVSLNNNTLFAADNNLSSPIKGTKTLCRFTFQVNSNVTPGSQITVSVNNLSLSDISREYPLGTKSVTFRVKEGAAASSKLSSLTVSGAAFNFSPNLTEYDIEVPNSVSQVTVTATAEDSSAAVTIRYNGITVRDGVVSLREGSSNYIGVEVKTADGSTRTYNVQVTRAAAGADEPPVSSEPPVLSSNNLLKDLSVSGLNIGFSPRRTEYDETVDHTVKEVTVLAEAQDEKAKVTLQYNGAAVNGNTITLRDGANYIGIVVQAENGASKTYNIEIRRSKAPVSSEPPVSSDAPTSSDIPVSSDAPASSDIPASSGEPTSSDLPDSSEPDHPSSSEPTSSAPVTSEPGAVIGPKKDLSGLVMHTAYIGGMVLCLLAGCMLGYFICERRKD